MMSRIAFTKKESAALIFSAVLLILCICCFYQSFHAQKEKELAIQTQREMMMMEIREMKRPPCGGLRLH